jgi:hypothetical protein
VANIPGGTQFRKVIATVRAFPGGTQFRKVIPGGTQFRKVIPGGTQFRKVIATVRAFLLAPRIKNA